MVSKKSISWIVEVSHPDGIYLFKVNIASARKMCEIFLKLAIKTLELKQQRHCKTWNCKKKKHKKIKLYNKICLERTYR